MALIKDNMSKEVEKEEQAASSAEEVEKEGVDASPTKEDVAELAEALAKSLAREEKLAEERDNYKQGMLKAKGKAKEDETEEENGTGDKKSESNELIGVVKQLLRINQELETAVVNKSQVASTGQGAGSEEKAKVGDNMLSDEQIKSLQAKGWDDVKIARFKQNLKNARA